MTISGLSSGLGWNSWIPDTLTTIHRQVDETAQQLATGKIGSTYAAFGSNVARSIGLNAKLSQLESSDGNLSTANLSLSTISQTITSFTTLAGNVSTGTLSPVQATDANARTSAQSSLRSSLSSLLDYINTQDGENYMFGGKSTGTPPALDVSKILDGDPSSGKAGLSTYVAERQMADQGKTGLGRLTLTTDAGGKGVTLAREIPNPAFGMTVNAVSSGLDNATATLSSTSPASLDVSFSGVPTAGTAITVTLGLPDGTTTDVTLTAASTAGTGQFAVGTDAASTASNFKAALTSALQTTSSTSLASASALKASKDFFAGSLTSPPQRVLAGSDGTAATATGYQTDAATNAAHTVIWYQGTGAASGEDPRQDRVFAISPDLKIGIGARGNEAGLADTLAAIGAAAVAKYSSTDENLAESQYSDMTSRAKNAVSAGVSEVQSMVTSFATAQQQVSSIKDQNTATKNVLTTMLSSLTDVTPEEAAANLSQLQTQLQVAYQVTANVMKLTLANYL
jgi:flagellar hook-associated protein 3 FlgL